MSLDDNFYNSQSPSSRVKAGIVAKYFPQYAKILLRKPQGKVVYLDFFAGKGIYDDGGYSTPILIAKKCCKSPELLNKVQLAFNDYKHSEELKENLEKKVEVGKFHYPPRYANKTIGDDEDINKYLKKSTYKNPSPTLLFFDPFGYKEIDTSLLASFLMRWGNEIFLFFNTKRINPALDNVKFDELIDKIFPKTKEEITSMRGYKKSVTERVNLIVENFAKEFKLHGVKNLLWTAFKFQEEDSKTTSHFLLHFTKDPKGFELAKQTYYDFDNIGAFLDNYGHYTFDPKAMDGNTLVFEDPNIRYLANALLKHYSGKEHSVQYIIDDHHITGKYTRRHYRLALRLLEEEKKVKARFDERDQKKHKFAVMDSPMCYIKFP